MELKDFEIGEIYCRENESNIYKCVEKTDKWVLVIEYSNTHYIATCEFWNQEYLDKSFNQSLQLVDESERDWDNKIFKDYLEARGEGGDTLYYAD